MSEELVFDNVTPIEIPVKVGGVAYTLREATGDAACKYRNAMARCLRFGPNGKPTATVDMADTEALLVSLCLFDANGKNVPVEVLRSWPDRISKALYNKAKQISELDDDEKKPAPKNEQDDTQAGSD